MSSTRHNIDAPDGAQRLDVLVATQLDISRNQAATLIAEGHVLVGGRREKASYRARAGEQVAVEIPPSPGREVLGEDIPLSVAYEDDDVLVVDKPAGMVVHPAPGNWSGTLVNALKGRGAALSEASEEGREGIVHRLDKETSGLLLVAKSDRAHRRLGAALQAR
jgi:23S rRNA pseudouridine1911/1915/1917 synthase